MACGCGSDKSGSGGGGCGTKFDKLDVFDWLKDMPENELYKDIVEVKFKNTRKSFFKNVSGSPVCKGDMVAVEASPGHDIGTVGLTGMLAGIQMEKYGMKLDADLKKIYRKARQTDIEKWESSRQRETDVLPEARRIAREKNMNMKISDIEIQGDGTKATVYYIADERVDFRELIKIYADAFKMRIEMRQIGARQEAGMVGGIGSCGRELCCSTWLTTFASVTTMSAKQQELPANSNKLTGQCGKLKCCLVYEVDSYLDAQKDFPAREIMLQTEEGIAYHQKTDVYKEIMWYSFDKQFYVNLTGVPVDRVKEIIELNKRGIKPKALIEKDDKKSPSKPSNDYTIEQESVTRFDSKNKRNKPTNDRRNRPAGNALPQNTEQVADNNQPEGQNNVNRSQQQQNRQPQSREQQPREHQHQNKHRQHRDNTVNPSEKKPNVEQNQEPDNNQQVRDNNTPNPNRQQQHPNRDNNRQQHNKQQRHHRGGGDQQRNRQEQNKETNNNRNNESDNMRESSQQEDKGQHQQHRNRPHHRNTHQQANKHRHRNDNNNNNTTPPPPPAQE